MKKLKWLFGFCMAILVLCGGLVNVKAEDVGANSGTEASDFSRKQNDDGTITITDYKGTDETVVIPSEINGKKVTIIGGFAFFERKDIKNVIIPKEVTIIENNAFNDCENLETVQLPERLKIIESHAFSFCENLETVQLPERLKIIEDNAFAGCHTLKDINFPTTLEEIGHTSFSGCKLKKIKFPNKLTVIGSNAFKSCYDLIEVEFTDGIQHIDLSAFWYCNLLNKIIIPNSVTSLKSYIPHMMGKNITIYANSNSYARTYANKNGIKFSCLDAHDWDKGAITTQPTAINDGIKTYTCTACKTTKTEKVAKLGLPKKGNPISDPNSNNTYKVTKSAVQNGTVEFAKVSKSASSIAIPDTVTVDGVVYKVTSVSKNAFKNNKKLKKVTIGKNIIKINANTFYGCKNLKTITIKTTNLKSVGKNAFRGINPNAKIKVPKSKLKSYKKLFSKKGQKSTVKIVK